MWSIILNNNNRVYGGEIVGEVEGSAVLLVEIFQETGRANVGGASFG